VERLNSCQERAEIVSHCSSSLVEIQGLFCYEDFAMRRPRCKSISHYKVKAVDFLQLVGEIRGLNAYIPERLLALDPGGTTGIAFFEKGKLKQRGVIKDYDMLSLENLIKTLKPDVVVVEEYVLYPWARKEQTWSDFPVPRFIGALQLICLQQKVELYFQTPADATKFCTDTKLKAWGYYKHSVGKDDANHINDAVRHGCYWILHRGKRTRPEPVVGKDWDHLKDSPRSNKPGRSSFHSGSRRGSR
jgi:hypothetical protein